MKQLSRRLSQLETAARNKQDSPVGFGRIEFIHIVLPPGETPKPGTLPPDVPGAIQWRYVYQDETGNYVEFAQGGNDEQQDQPPA